MASFDPADLCAACGAPHYGARRCGIQSRGVSFPPDVYMAVVCSECWNAGRSGYPTYPAALITQIRARRGAAESLAAAPVLAQWQEIWVPPGGVFLPSHAGPFERIWIPRISACCNEAIVLYANFGAGSVSRTGAVESGCGHTIQWPDLYAMRWQRSSGAPPPPQHQRYTVAARDAAGFLHCSIPQCPSRSEYAEAAVDGSWVCGECRAIEGWRE